MNAVFALTRTIRNTFLWKWYDALVLDNVRILRNEGPRVLIRRKGKRIIAFVIAYYLVRDSILYILLPYLVARGIL